MEVEVARSDLSSSLDRQHRIRNERAPSERPQPRNRTLQRKVQAGGRRDSH